MNTRANVSKWSWIQLDKRLTARASMLLLLCLTAVTGTAQTYSVLQNLSGHPIAGLTLSGSTLYGTVPGPYAGGVFKINTDGTGYTGLIGFGENEGSPLAGLVLSGATLYGTTAGAQNPNSVYRYRYGIIFKVNTNGSGYTVLRNFSGGDGAYPKAGLVLSGETLYGTTRYGPVITNGGTAYYGNGTLFKINTDGSGFATLRSFGGYEGADPVGGLALSGTTLYGTTSSGGYGGTIFKINTDGTGYTVLRYGMYGLWGDLVLSGTTLYGTSSDVGVFKINTDGTGFTGLKSLDSQAGLVLSNQTLYGTTASGGISNAGTVFRINTDGSRFGVLKHFTGSDGSMPVAPVVFSGDTLCGKLYGTTKNGGTLGAGVVFSLSLAPPSILTPPASQAVATGSPAHFSVVAGGSDPLEYQWLFNATNSVQGATNSVLALTNAQPSWSGAYSVVIANSCGSVTSSPAMLSVTDAAPIIVTSPTDQVARLGATAEFDVVARGMSPLSYQWWFNATTRLPGATNAVLQLTNLTLSQAGAYTATVTNLLGAVTSSPAILTVMPPGGMVTKCTEADLRGAMAWGGTITFACAGTITLSKAITVAFDTTLDASGPKVTISGADTVRVFNVSTNVTLTAVNLTIANGRSTNGAGIFNAGGTLILQGVTFQTNVATGDPGGGAIFNQGGTVQAANCVFSGNVADKVLLVGNGPPTSSGGALYNAGTFVASACAFLQNQATGRTFPAPAPEAADGRGGAICNVGVLSIDGSVFVSNAAIGLWGNNGQDSSGNSGSPGGSAHGGALFNAGVATLVNSTIVSNTCTGGNGGSGGCARYTMVGRERYYYGAGGNGGYGGSGIGGGICSDGYLVKMTNCTVAFNAASGGVGGARGDGAPPGSTGVNGTAGGAVQTDGNSPLINNILASNSPTNCSGTVTDLGHNLSSDGSSAFTNTSSLKSTSPLLGPLANNGGPTLTMALLAGSPAIDAGDDAAAPRTDQRGYPRPFSLAADIGAFEFGWTTVQASQPGSGGIDILASGISGQTCWLLVSSNYSSWMPIATNQMGSDGTCLFHDDCAPGAACRFYRLLMP